MSCLSQLKMMPTCVLLNGSRVALLCRSSFLSLITLEVVIKLTVNILSDLTELKQNSSDVLPVCLGFGLFHENV